MWSQLLPQFDLPEHITQPNGQQQPTTIVLGNLYTMLIGPFEAAYRKNMQEQNHRAMLSRNAANPAMSGHPRPDGLGGMPGGFPPQMNPLQRQASNPSLNPATMGGMGPTPPNADPALGAMGPFATPPTLSQAQQFSGFPGGPARAPSLGLPDGPANGAPSPQPGATFPPMFPGAGADVGAIDGESDLELRKRKMRESEELDVKRVRQKTSKSFFGSSRTAS